MGEQPVIRAEQHESEPNLRVMVDKLSEFLDEESRLELLDAIDNEDEFWWNVATFLIEAGVEDPNEILASIDFES